ncbi:MAG: PglZ domain family protein [Thermomicrobium sp.]|nr:PglZ domain family protein [Thermomicrobium sp.]
MREVWLDEDGLWPPRPGTVLISDDVSFLEEINTEHPLLIRGRQRCAWARALAEARDWRVYEVQPPNVELQALCASLTEEQAEEIVERLGQRVWDLPRPLTLTAVAEALYGGYFWRHEPSEQHASAWLTWLVERAPTGVDAVLTRALAGLWQERSDGITKYCYRATTREEATSIIVETLGLQPSPYTSEEWEKFPLNLQECVTRTIREWVRKRLVESDGQAVDDWIAAGVHPQVWSHIRNEVYSYFKENPKHLTLERLDVLRPYLSFHELGHLARFCPRPDPGLPPEGFEAVCQWFRDRYLPWREWTLSSGDEAALERAREIGRRFATWCLEQYPKLGVSPQAGQLFGWARVNELRTQPDDATVTLLVILDGCGMSDAASLLRHLQAETDCFTVTRNDVVLTSVPTVTQFTKPALLEGVPPDQIRQADPDETSSRLREVIAALERAAPGAVVTWRLSEPDASYHRARTQEDANNEVDLRLRSIARALRQIADEVPAARRLRVVLTTDHGRLLGKAQRTLKVPPGWQTHGRAAWGPSRGEKIPSGFRIEDGTALLDAAAYDLPAEYAYRIALTDEAFVTSDGRGGQEWFPHGGLFPEEVLVPWIELERDLAVPSPVVAIKGDGRAYGSGTLEVVVTNIASIPLELQEVLLRFRQRKVTVRIGETVGPSSKVTISRPIELWPAPQDCREVQVRLTYRLPSGIHRSTPVAEINLKSRPLYEQANILEDLQ